MNSPIKLRPHHLLCTQTYSGKGYSSDFVENMDIITSRLRLAPETIVEIVTTTDDICAKCPLVIYERATSVDSNSELPVCSNRQKGGQAQFLPDHRITEAGFCATQEKVQRIDGKVMAHFDVCEKTYAYGHITREIGEKINASIFEDICGECEWYSICEYAGSLYHHPKT